MKKIAHRVCRGIPALLLCLSTAAHADFYNALKGYKEGKFPEAAVMFRELAELGNGASQFNLGVMHVRGEGMEKNQGVGLGWLLAAHENGYTQMTPEKLSEFKSKLTPAQAADADAIVARYGRQALDLSLLPGAINMQCRSYRGARVDQRARANYPLVAMRDHRDGVVMIEVTVGVDGLARDPHVLIGVPEDLFDNATIDAYLKSRFVPAVHNGQKVESRFLTHFTYFFEQGGDLWKLGSVNKLREAAEQKDPNAQYLIGMIGSLDPTLNVSREDARAMLVASAQSGQPNAQYWAAHQVQSDALCGSGNKVLTWLQHAAKGGDHSAQIELARYRIENEPEQLNADEVKKLVAAAAGSNNPYAMKHAVAILTTSSNDALRDPQLALNTAKRLQKYNGNLDPHVDEAIAAAFAANSNFKEAGKSQDLAIENAKRLYWNTELMAERRANYATGKPAKFGDLFAVPPATDPPPPIGDEAIDCQKRKDRCRREGDDNRTPTGSFIK